MHQRIINSPMGLLRVEIIEDRLTRLDLMADPEENYRDEHPLLDETERQICEYFDGKRQEFNLPIHYEGTMFQKEVWAALGSIPYGATCSYKDIASKIKREKAVRAVGQANKRNPLPIVIPCHRVVGKNGSMTGYAGTHINKKELLLNLESRFSNRNS
ncbi:methylated-DNA--[protein]-cysteine S-methyltransferase [Jeotgalibacillus sp. S-D1]|uniref:methylated-DNA--[protein]-cysteine S-methyltransferase n=1 Tax=Jeotgalibacillus sp. S-D1 TaxID=2552189 RepID=UPI0026C58663|nr:methylated-DNA--[protein]-cysteine S-methyltransferase [Jeotgalibacillus sp. S-D1]